MPLSSLRRRVSSLSSMGKKDLLVRSGLEDVGLYSLGVSLFVSLEVGLFDVGLDATQVALSVSAVDTRGHTEQEAHRTIRLDAGRTAGGVDAEDAGHTESSAGAPA